MLFRSVDTIAFTYNEPMVWFEYIMDIAKIAPELNIVLQTNGWVNDGPLKELCSVVDAMSIDIKAFDRALCKEICDGELKDVMINTHTVIEKGNGVDGVTSQHIYYSKSNTPHEASPHAHGGDAT